MFVEFDTAGDLVSVNPAHVTRFSTCRNDGPVVCVDRKMQQVGTNQHVTNEGRQVCPPSITHPSLRSQIHMVDSGIVIVNQDYQTVKAMLGNCGVAIANTSKRLTSSPLTFDQLPLGTRFRFESGSMFQDRDGFDNVYTKVLADAATRDGKLIERVKASLRDWPVTIVDE